MVTLIALLLPILLAITSASASDLTVESVCTIRIHPGGQISVEIGKENRREPSPSKFEAQRWEEIEQAIDLALEQAYRSKLPKPNPSRKEAP